MVHFIMKFSNEVRKKAFMRFLLPSVTGSFVQMHRNKLGLAKHKALNQSTVNVSLEMFTSIDIPWLYDNVVTSFVGKVRIENKEIVN